MRIIGCIFLIALIGCSKAQYTSGGQYLKGYKQAPKEGLDKEVYDVANIEPNLKFPARIGIARIDHGVLTSIPEVEMEKWNELAKELGSELGSFIPVNRLIATMVKKQKHSKDSYRSSQEDRMQEVIENLRLGAARQHLDVVYVYEVFGDSRSYITPAYIANITIIGAFLLPGRNIKAKGFASGLLLDVRNGYPYGTAEASVNDQKYLTSANSREKGLDLVEKLKREASLKLVDETRVMIKQLKAEILVASESK